MYFMWIASVTLIICFSLFNWVLGCKVHLLVVLGYKYVMRAKTSYIILKKYIISLHWSLLIFKEYYKFDADLLTMFLIWFVNMMHNNSL